MGENIKLIHAIHRETSFPKNEIIGLTFHTLVKNVNFVDESIMR